MALRSFEQSPVLHVAPESDRAPARHIGGAEVAAALFFFTQVLPSTLHVSSAQKHLLLNVLPLQTALRSGEQSPLEHVARGSSRAPDMQLGLGPCAASLFFFTQVLPSTLHMSSGQTHFFEKKLPTHLALRSGEHDPVVHVAFLSVIPPQVGGA
jgi:hypothetical protein